MSILLHALVLLVHREHAQDRTKWFRNNAAAPLEVELRPRASSMRPGRSPRREEIQTRNPEVAAEPSRTESLPRIDWDVVHKVAREQGSGTAGAWTLAGLRRDTPLGSAIASASRADCRTAYASAGLLALVFLAKDALSEDGCKW